MGRSLGRVWAPAAACLLVIELLLRPESAIGQEEEIIVDPELAGSSGTSSSAAGDEEIIEDPELGVGAPGAEPEADYGWGTVYKPSQEEGQTAQPLAPEEDEFDPLANTGIAKMEVIGQGAADLHHEGSLEDFYEARLRAGGEIDFRLSRKLRLSMGTRLDFAWYAPYQNDPALTRLVSRYDSAGNTLVREVHQTARSQARYELDIVPLSAYVDATLAAGVHLRVGEQVISLARMDGFSVTDMLAVYDLRPQARATPSGLKLAQPAVRLDWDFNSWSTLQLVYVPWFMPHLTRPNRDRYVGGALTGFAQPNPDPMMRENEAVSAGRVQHTIDQLVSPSYQTVAQQSALRFVGPAPNFKNPQAEARLNFRGSTFELALLGGTALEKLPALYYTPAVGDALLNSNTQSQAFGDIAAATARGQSVVDVQYHRYYLAGFDGSFDVAPLQFGFEFAYSPARHLYAMKNDGSQLPLPDVSEPITDATDEKASNVTDRSIRKGTPMVQAAVHAEYLKGESFMLLAEAFMLQALQLPHDLTRSWAGFKKAKGTYVGGLVGASYDIKQGLVRFDASALLLMGPSLIVTPQVEVRVVDGFYLSLGAQIFEGPTPNNVGKTAVAATNLTPGGVFSGYDNAYLGFRWIPN